jgi:putative nucleotidyltransferase with HDIG domain
MTELRVDRLAPDAVALLRALLDAGGRKRGAVLVGGAVRDALLRRRREGVDVDVAVERDALALARRVADRVAGAFVELDAERGAGRVVTPGGRLDVTDLRAPTLDADLASRDFTVNALAVRLEPLLAAGRAAILDPTGGGRDIVARRLRPPDVRVLDDDPLRGVRGVRLEAELRFRLTPAAVRAIRARAAALRRVSAERVRDELLAMLRLPRTERAVRRLDALALLGVILPEIEAMRRPRQPAPHRFSVLEHSLRALAGADRVLARLHALTPYGEELEAHVAEPLGGGVDRRMVLKLAALLHDVSKPETRREVNGRIRFFEHDLRGAERVRVIGDRLRLPDRATRLLERLVRQHLRPMHLAQSGPVTPRARYRFFRDLGADARDLLLLALVDAAAVTGASPFVAWRRASLIRDLLAGWQDVHDAVAAPPLVTGNDVMQRFGLEPGPHIGELLRRAREAQDLGLVATRDEALSFLDSPADGPYSSA